MRLNKNEIIFFVVNSSIILGFLSYFYFSKDSNYEFIIYIATIFVLLIILYNLFKKIKLSVLLLLAITSWVILHLLSGTLQIGDGVLYEYKLIEIFDRGGEFFILKMDQLLHFYVYFVIVFIMYTILVKTMDYKQNKYLIAILAFLSAIGIGVINELVEFSAVVLLNDTGVGGYYNTLLDLVFNSIGALVAVIIAFIYNNKKLD